MEELLVAVLVAASIDWIERDALGAEADAGFYGDLGSNLAQNARREAVYGFLDSQEPGFNASPCGPEDLGDELPLEARKMWA